MNAHLPFFLLGAYSFIYPPLKQVFLTFSPGALVASVLLFGAYYLNQHINTSEFFAFELDLIIKALMGYHDQRCLFSWASVAQLPFPVSLIWLTPPSSFIWCITH